MACLLVPEERPFSRLEAGTTAGVVIEREGKGAREAQW